MRIIMIIIKWWICWWLTDIFQCNQKYETSYQTSQLVWDPSKHQHLQKTSAPASFLRVLLHENHRKSIPSESVCLLISLHHNLPFSNGGIELTTVDWGGEDLISWKRGNKFFNLSIFKMMTVCMYDTRKMLVDKILFCELLLHMLIKLLF